MRLLAFLFAASILAAQPSTPPSVIYVTSDPAGACAASTQLRFNTSNGKLWGCNALTWGQIGGSGAPTGSAGGDLGGTYPNPSVVKINGMSLAGLATGILKNTTTTGVPSIAVAADVIGLFSTCSGTQYLGADGACHTASGATPGAPDTSLQYRVDGTTFGGIPGSTLDLSTVQGANDDNVTGLDDATFAGTYTDSVANPGALFIVVIDSTGTPDKFKWSKNNGSFTTGVSITGAAQTLSDGVTVQFGATTGHTAGDAWYTIIKQTVSVTGALSVSQTGASTQGESLFSSAGVAPTIALAFAIPGAGVSVSGAIGGTTTNTAAASGGRGGDFSFSSGAGGPASGGLTSSTGGAGGDFSILAGHGAGNGPANSAIVVGGSGGWPAVRAGTGGDADGGTVTSTGGAGGETDIIGGAGGNALGTGAGTGGVGGNVLIQGGNGGFSANGSTNTGADGGSVLLQPGNGGTGGTANGLKGKIVVNGAYAMELGTCAAATLATILTANRDYCYCTDCKVTSGSDNTCTSSGNGAFAFKINGAAKCVQ